MSKGIAGKVALVTGGASGIGAATARRFVAEGARVVIADVNEVGARVLAAELGDASRAVGGDISKPADASRLVACALEHFGRLDILHNNAASGAGGRIADIDVESWNRTLAINLSGHFYMSRAALPVMLERGGGVIVNMSSAAALRVEEGIGAYAAAKAGVIALTRQIAVEYGRRGIRANCVCPGSVATPPTLAFMGAVEGMREKMEAATPLRRIAAAEELANVIVFLASGEASYVNGATIVVDGGSIEDNTVGIMGGE